MIAYHKKETPESPNLFKQAIDKASTDLKPENFVNLTEYKEKIFPSLNASLRINDLQLGKGLPAVCGQEAVITFESWLGETKKLEEATEEKPLRFFIGAGEVMPVFEQGVIGMQPGGIRSIIAPMHLSYGVEKFKRDTIAPSATITFNIKLVGISPELPNPDKAPYRATISRPGSGEMHICGSTVNTKITMWDMEGKKIFSNDKEGDKPVTFTLGKSEVFIGLEQGAVGMRVGEMRTLVVPPSFQKPMRDISQVTDFPFPNNQTVLVDVELLP